MAVTLLERNSRGYCEFGYDNWSEDGDKLPRIGVKGKDNLSTINSCSQNSIAIGTDGTVKVLNGDTNEWIDF